MAGAPLGSQNRAGGAAINQVLLEEARRDRWDLVRKGVRQQLLKAAKGDLTSLAWCYDRIAGRAVAQVEVNSSEAREIDLETIMRLVMQARSASADDAQLIENSAESQPDPPTP